MSRDRQGIRRTFLRGLLLLYPREFRERYGEEFLAFLARQREDERYAGPFGAGWFWGEVLWDCLKNGVAGRAAVTRRRLMEIMGGTMMDLRATTRGLARRRGFSLLVVSTLGLGIAAATSIFTLADWVLMRPVPGVGDEDRIVTIHFQPESGSGGYFLASHPDFLDLKAGTPALEALAGSSPADVHVTLPGGVAPLRMPVEMVTGEYAGALGLAPGLGRFPRPEAEGEVREVVMSHGLWQRAFGGNPAVLGRILPVNGKPFTVVGVAPRGFRGPRFPAAATELWMSVAAFQDVVPAYPPSHLSNRRSAFYMSLVGRLREGATAETAQEQLLAARVGIVESYDDTNLGRVGPAVVEGVGAVPEVRERVAGTMRILMAAVVGLLLLACANAGGLLLARGLERQGELHTRRALGAGRGQILRLLLAEGVILGLLAGVLGIGAASGGLKLFSGQRLLFNLPDLEGMALDPRVLGFALVLSLATGVMTALVPALTASLREAGALHSGLRVSRGHRILNVLVVGQMALSLSLVAASGLLVDTVRALNNSELGFEPEGVLEVTVDPGRQGYPEEETMAFWRQLLADAGALPGVEGVGLAWAPLQGPMASDVRVAPEGAPEEDQLRAYHNLVGGRFLEATGFTLVEGREFVPEEVLADPPRDVVVISRSLAASFFPPGSALGSRVSLAYRPGRTFEVVGVVEDARVRTPKTLERNLLFEPLGQPGWVPGWSTLYVRAQGPLRRLLPRLQEVVRAQDPDLPLYDVQPLTERIRTRSAEENLLARLTAVFAVLSILLAGVGIHGVLAQVIGSRKQELGIRAALGASSLDIGLSVFRQGGITTVLGLLLGAALIPVAVKLVESRLWGVAAFNPVVFGISAAVLVAVAAVSCWFPARTAARTDPVRALKVN